MFEAISAVVIAVVAGIAFWWVGTQQGYDDGWCAAKGGITIAVRTCNVNGKVVEVK